MYLVFIPGSWQSSLNPCFPIGVSGASFYYKPFSITPEFMLMMGLLTRGNQQYGKKFGPFHLAPRPLGKGEGLRQFSCQWTDYVLFHWAVPELLSLVISC